jgi:hypothetical protein
METKLKLIYWKGDKFWVGKLLEHPEIMTQGETLEELEENMKDAYMLMTMASDVRSGQGFTALSRGKFCGPCNLVPTLLMSSKKYTVTLMCKAVWMRGGQAATSFAGQVKSSGTRPESHWVRLRKEVCTASKKLQMRGQPSWRIHGRNE